jgi:hypothetical protein
MYYSAPKNNAVNNISENQKRRKNYTYAAAISLAESGGLKLGRLTLLLKVKLYCVCENKIKT